MRQRKNVLGINEHINNLLMLGMIFPENLHDHIQHIQKKKKLYSSLDFCSSRN